MCSTRRLEASERSVGESVGSVLGDASLDADGGATPGAAGAGLDDDEKHEEEDAQTRGKEREHGDELSDKCG